MDLRIVKHYMQELHDILAQEPNNPVFVRLCLELETTLNTDQFKNIKETRYVPIFVLQTERKRRQAVENLLTRLQRNPDYPDEVKSDIAKAHQETIREYHTQMKNLRQIRNQANAEAG